MTLAINILHRIPGAKHTTGLTVVIDVCRAFTTAAFCAARGAGAIYPVRSVGEALALREQFLGSLTFGEVKGFAWT